MNTETLHKLLDIQEFAMHDETYRRLHEAYSIAHELFLQFYRSLSESDRHMIDDYLSAAVSLHHRLLILAIENKESPKETDCSSMGVL